MDDGGTVYFRYRARVKTGTGITGGFCSTSVRGIEETTTGKTDTVDVYDIYVRR